MSTAKPRSTVYPFLRFAKNVDWQHVDQTLLQKLNGVGARQNKIIDVISGYRTPEHSVAVGGFANDPHTRGIAVDAEINGRPIARVIPAKILTAAGLVSGDQPGFFNGKPDPGHVQLPTSGATAASAPVETTPAPTDTTATADTQPATTPAAVGPTGTVAPPVAAPVPTMAANLAPRDITAPVLWQQIAGQDSLVSPDTQAFLQNAQTASGGAT